MTTPPLPKFFSQRTVTPKEYTIPSFRSSYASKEISNVRGWRNGAGLSSTQTLMTFSLLMIAVVQTDTRIGYSWTKIPSVVPTSVRKGSNLFLKKIKRENRNEEEFNDLFLDDSKQKFNSAAQQKSFRLSYRTRKNHPFSEISTSSQKEKMEWRDCAGKTNVPAKKSKSLETWGSNLESNKSDKFAVKWSHCLQRQYSLPKQFHEKNILFANFKKSGVFLFPLLDLDQEKKTLTYPVILDCFGMTRGKNRRNQAVTVMNHMNTFFVFFPITRNREKLNNEPGRRRTLSGTERQKREVS